MPRQSKRLRRQQADPVDETGGPSPKKTPRKEKAPVDDVDEILEVTKEVDGDDPKVQEEPQPKNDAQEQQQLPKTTETTTTATIDGTPVTFITTDEPDQDVSNSKVSVILETQNEKSQVKKTYIVLQGSSQAIPINVQLVTNDDDDDDENDGREGETIGTTTIGEDGVVVETISVSDLTSKANLEQLACDYDDCDFVGHSPDQLQVHLDERHPGAASFGGGREGGKKWPFQCPDCDYSTAHKHNLKLHEITHLPPELKVKHKCPQCDYVSQYKHDLQTHMMKHEPEKPYKCEKCDFESIYKHSLMHHISSVHDKLRPYKCKQCSYASARKQDLNTHMGIHQTDKPLKCQVEGCDYSTHYKQSMKAHLEKHRGNKPFRCDVEGCTFATNTKQNLRSHKIRHSEDKPYKCAHCDYSAANKYLLTNHELRHDDQRPEPSRKFVCEECGYSTAHKHSLDRHRVRHDPNRAPLEKSYACQECGYKTGYKNSLKRHLATHSSLKPFKCGHCDYSAINMTQMHVHIAKHTGVKPFKCEKCSYSTANKQHLVAHQAKHSEVKLKCQYCDFSTSWKQRLRVHLKLHQTGTLQNTCVHCPDFVTSNRADFKAHMRSHGLSQLSLQRVEAAVSPAAAAAPLLLQAQSQQVGVGVGAPAAAQEVSVSDLSQVSVETSEAAQALHQITDVIAAYEAQTSRAAAATSQHLETQEVNEVDVDSQQAVYLEVEPAAGEESGMGKQEVVILRNDVEGGQEIQLVDEAGNHIQTVMGEGGQIQIIRPAASQEGGGDDARVKATITTQ